MEKVQKKWYFSYLTYRIHSALCVCLYARGMYVHAYMLYMWMLIHVHVYACRDKETMSRIFRESPLPSSF